MMSTVNSIARMAMCLFACFLVANLAAVTHAQNTVELSDEQVEDIVRRSWQYVAMYNVNNKFSMDPSNSW